MSLPGIFRRLFDNDGYGPKLKVKIVPPAYELCEFYYFRHPSLRPGFQPAQGGVIENAAALYPEAWEYLQTAEGQLLCKTEAEWQALTTAVWHTLADGTQVGWNGIGGAPYFVQDLEAGTLRLPDIRGMYAEAAGFDALGVGDAHGDMIRNITGWVGTNTLTTGGGVFYDMWTGGGDSGGGTYNDGAQFNASRVVPTGNANKPRAWGALGCVYLGHPTS